MQRIIIKDLLLENHRLYIYECDSMDEVMEKLELYQRYKTMFLKKYPNARFRVKADMNKNPRTLTIETWTLPKLFQN